jgi:hypothetical protein
LVERVIKVSHVIIKIAAVRLLATARSRRRTTKTIGMLICSCSSITPITRVLIGALLDLEVLTCISETRFKSTMSPHREASRRRGIGIKGKRGRGYHLLWCDRNSSLVTSDLSFVICCLFQM